MRASKFDSTGAMILLEYEVFQAHRYAALSTDRHGSNLLMI
jgi:hypothetical protein